MSDDRDDRYWNGYWFVSSSRDTEERGHGCSVSLFKIVAIVVVVMLILALILGVEVTWPAVKFLLTVVLIVGGITVLCK